MSPSVLSRRPHFTNPAVGPSLTSTDCAEASSGLASQDPQRKWSRSRVSRGADADSGHVQGDVRGHSWVSGGRWVPRVPPWAPWLPGDLPRGCSGQRAEGTLLRVGLCPRWPRCWGAQEAQEGEPGGTHTCAGLDPGGLGAGVGGRQQAPQGQRGAAGGHGRAGCDGQGSGNKGSVSRERRSGLGTGRQGLQQTNSLYRRLDRPPPLSLGGT